MANSLDFKGLAESLLSEARILLPQWLPGGKFVGKNYVCANLRGGKGESLSFNYADGFGSDFATTDKFGDMISLYAAIHGLSQGEAYTTLGGIEKRTNDPVVPDFKHPKLNILPVAVWRYLSPVGNPLMAVARYEGPEGRTFVPWSINGGSAWKPKSLPAPRPLYGLNLLEARPNAPVLVVEGEKAAEAAKTLLPTYVVVTWPFGAQAWNKADWKPLYGRSLVLWPDADEPGSEAMRGISELLASHCPVIKILDTIGMPLAWDAADAVIEGMNADSLNAWIDKTVPLPRKISFVPESIADLLTRPEPVLEWLIDNIWVDKARGLIAGNPGVGKTWMALEMLLSVSSGLPCLGKYPVRSAPVLLVEEEASQHNLARRVHAMARHRGLTGPQLGNFFHITRQFIKIPTHELELVDFIKSHGIKLVVFDSLRRFHGVDENSSEKMQPILDSFGRINLNAGCSVVLIHHLSKQQEKNKKPVFERMRGTSDLWAWRDCIIGMEGQEESEEATCLFQFRDAESPMPITVRRVVDDRTGAMGLVAVNLEESVKFGEQSQAIIAFVKSQYAGASKNAICKAVGGNKDANLKLLKRLEKQGLLKLEMNDNLVVPDYSEPAGTAGTSSGSRSGS